jgi:monovalent cation:H+ antiporter-2, CPA2 family
VALGIAFGAAALFGVSFALGAFLAGMVINGSDLSHEAATDALPLQDAFSVLFFVAVGMLFDPRILLEQPLEVLTVVLIVVVGKSLAAFLIVLLFRHSIATALSISASLAQIGEFSFILAALGLELGLLPADGQSLIVAGALISITLNPLVFSSVPRATRWIHARPRLRALLERSSDPLAESPPGSPRPTLREHVVVVGFGRVGSAVGEALARQAIPFAVVEQSRDLVESLRARGLEVVYGDAARTGVLARAEIERARLLVVAIPEPFQVRAILERARSAHPGIDTLARTHSENERDYLERHGVGLALLGEHELALALAHHALVRMGCAEDQADAAVIALRRRRPMT